MVDPVKPGLCVVAAVAVAVTVARAGEGDGAAVVEVAAMSARTTSMMCCRACGKWEKSAAGQAGGRWSGGARGDQHLHCCVIWTVVRPRNCCAAAVQSAQILASAAVQGRHVHDMHDIPLCSPTLHVSHVRLCSCFQGNAEPPSVSLPDMCTRC